MNYKLFRAWIFCIFCGMCCCVSATNTASTAVHVVANQPRCYDDFAFEEDAFCLTRASDGQKLIDYAKSKYEVTITGRQCLFYPAKNAKRLVISFGYGGVGGFNYFLWSWFWRDDEAWDDTAYLFVRDLDTTWYFGNEEKSFVEDYSLIINHFIQLTKVSREHVFAFGLSMGGAAAVFYSVLLKLKGALVVNPVLNNDLCALEICPGGWRESISKCRWQNVFKLIKDDDALPNVALLFGTEDFDEFSAYSLIQALKKQHVNMIFHHAGVKDHALFGALNITKSFIDNEIEYLDRPTNPGNELDAVEGIM